MLGKVKFFNDVKGYGFINSNGIPEDIFVHHTGIHMEGYRCLFPGQEVEFELKTDQRGMKAVKVRVVGGAVPAPATGKAS